MSSYFTPKAPPAPADGGPPRRFGDVPRSVSGDDDDKMDLEEYSPPDVKKLETQLAVALKDNDELREDLSKATDGLQDLQTQLFLDNDRGKKRN